MKLCVTLDSIDKVEIRNRVSREMPRRIYKWNIREIISKIWNKTALVVEMETKKNEQSCFLAEMSNVSILALIHDTSVKNSSLPAEVAF